MTLIVGIKCEDGVVLGADGAATYAVPLLGRPTIRQPHRKLMIIGEHLVLGVSGPVGLGQSYQLDLARTVKSNNNRSPWANRSKADNRRAVHEIMWKHAKVAWENAEVVARSQGREAALAECLHQSIVALPVGDEACLFQFDHQCQPEEATTDLPFISIGSAQPTADPFLAFIRRVFWPRALPPIGEGELASVWTLQHAIETQPGGVAEPIQVVTLRRSEGTTWKADELSEDRLGEHQQMIAEIEKKMKEIPKTAFSVQPTQPIPGR